MEENRVGSLSEIPRLMALWELLEVALKEEEGDLVLPETPVHISRVQHKRWRNETTTRPPARASHGNGQRARQRYSRDVGLCSQKDMLAKRRPGASRLCPLCLTPHPPPGARRRAQPRQLGSGVG